MKRKVMSTTNIYRLFESNNCVDKQSVKRPKADIITLSLLQHFFPNINGNILPTLRLKAKRADQSHLTLPFEKFVN